VTEKGDLGELQTWLSQAPPGTLVPADSLAQAIAASVPNIQRRSVVQRPMSWRERLWLVAPDTRLGVAELLEALGRTKSWLYRHTGPNSPGTRIPHRKLEGELVFVAGEICNWVRDNELVRVPGRTANLMVVRKREAK